ncbi:MAG TPA: sugar phosphate isomerase/epimerase [Chthonomonadaceae bacterium]|nr:sugar phosphate isomerase/epimerase [Chthonomonadaceae bacterium]
MQIGIFERVFRRPTLGATLDAVRSHGLTAVQFDLASAGLPSLPDEIAPDQAAAIRAELDLRGVAMAAVSGTFNIIHPDEARRRDGMRRLRVLAAASGALGTPAITLSTGTRDAANMWRHHPDNASEEAWRDCLRSMAEIAAIGAEHGVAMAFEPEVNNVVDSAAKARRLLDEIGSPALKVVMDGANIFHAGELPRMAAILDEAFALLGPDIALAHAKDLDRDGDAGHLPAGQGLLDYGRYLRLLSQSGYTGPLILHGLTEPQVDTCIAFLVARGA